MAKRFDFESWADHVVTMVETVGKLFSKHDDDWMPCAFLHSVRRGVFIIGATGFRDNDDKDAWAETIKRSIVDERPDFAALVLSTWQRTVLVTDPLAELTVEMNKRFGVSTDPKREEMLMVDVSDGKRNQTRQAKIVRDGKNPPTLSEWETFDHKRFDEFSGPMAGILQKGFDRLRRNIRK